MRIKRQPDQLPCQKGDSHCICVIFGRLVSHALCGNHQQKCHQVSRQPVPKLHHLSELRSFFSLLLAPGNQLPFVLFPEDGNN